MSHRFAVAFLKCVCVFVSLLLPACRARGSVLELRNTEVSQEKEGRRVEGKKGERVQRREVKGKRKERKLFHPALFLYIYFNNNFPLLEFFLAKQEAGYVDMEIGNKTS